MKQKNAYLLSVISGLLLSVSWFGAYFPLFIFVALVPLLLAEEHFSKQTKATAKIGVMRTALITFLLWNSITTWWIVYSTFVGMLLAVVLNSLLMTVIFLFYHIVKRQLKPGQSNITVFIVFWLVFEFFHHEWQVSWPWLSFGNVFGANPHWVQWYSFTGMFGGSLWVLLVNSFIFLAIKQFLQKGISRSVYINGGIATLLFLVPMIISYSIYYSYNPKGEDVNVVVVQPNKDPWSQQYDLPPEINTADILTLASKKVDSTTDFLVAPESALYNNIWEGYWNQSASLQMMDTFLFSYPNLEIVVGASTKKMYKDGDVLPSSVREFYGGGFYDAYNTALFLSNNNNPQVHHKSKLVPGVEAMPFNSVMKHVQKIVFDLGGMTGTLGTDPTPIVFISNNDSIIIAPIICFESIYSDFVAEFVQKGANLIFVITNDGWWSDSPGYLQHFRFSRLRAIETRRDIARSANTGVSAFINQKGDVVEKTEFWKTAVLKHTMRANNEKTFFVIYGNYISRIAILISILLILVGISRRLQRK